MMPSIPRTRSWSRLASSTAISITPPRSKARRWWVQPSPSRRTTPSSPEPAARITKKGPAGPLFYFRRLLADFGKLTLRAQKLRAEQQHKGGEGEGRVVRHVLHLGTADEAGLFLPVDIEIGLQQLL